MNQLAVGITWEVVRERHSVRRFTEEAMSDEHRRELGELVEACNARGGLHIQLVTDEPRAYGRSFWAHYGRFSNVRNYICLVGGDEEGVEERLGYYGEVIALRAQAAGLNTCWTGLSYAKRHTVYEAGAGERLYALIAIGYGESGGAVRKSKRAEEVSKGYESGAEWFREGVECALLAPTALNQQKFRFELLEGDRVRATTKWGFYSRMDLGIAKLHFEIGAGGHEFVWV